MFTAEKNLANFFLVIHTKKSMLVSQSETPLTAEMYDINAFPGIPILQEMISEKKKEIR